MNRIKELRLEKDLKQAELAKILKVAQNTLSTWENGKYEPDLQAINQLASFFNVSVDYLLGRVDSPQKRKGIKIPVLGKVPAGVPIEAIEEVLDHEEITPEMAQKGPHFALRIEGNSMEPDIRDGDIVIVRQQSDFESGDVVIVLVNGYDATCKKIVKHENGLTLIGYNTVAYPPHFYTAKEVQELPVQVIGLVVELRRTLKR